MMPRMPADEGGWTLDPGSISENDGWGGRADLLLMKLKRRVAEPLSVTCPGKV
jgi:hypothetical protein